MAAGGGMGTACTITYWGKEHGAKEKTEGQIAWNVYSDILGDGRALGKGTWVQSGCQADHWQCRSAAVPSEAHCQCHWQWQAAATGSEAGCLQNSKS